jgi:hypothetical protein
MDQNDNPTPEKPTEGSVGPAIGVIIIIAVLVIGALYFWGSRLNKEPEQSTSTPETGFTDQSATTTD